MELWNSTSEEFKDCGLKVIKDYGEVLIKIRYPYQAGDRDFFMLKTEKDFIEFINSREARDSITIYKTVEKVKQGIINKEFINEALEQLKKPKYYDWLIILPNLKFEKEYWHYDDTIEELKDTFELYPNHYIQILEDPEYLEEEDIIHAYVPDKDGEIRPGAY